LIINQLDKINNFIDEYGLMLTKAEINSFLEDLQGIKDDII
jgi:hypothetical protein